MENNLTFEISIPADEDGYILLQCKYCGTYFKITAEDIDDERLLNIYCPCCGLVSDSYITEEVIELAQVMIQNYTQDLLYQMFKDLEKKSKNQFVQFKAGKRPQHEYENPIRTSIELLKVKEFKCCKRSAKIKPLLNMTGCYCPFCGVKEYETKRN